MKRNTFCLFVLAILITSGIAAQQPTFPRPDKSKDIPFGKKPTTAPQIDERDKKLFQTLYPGADKSKYFNNIIAENKRSSPQFFQNSNSFLWQHLANRDKQITSTKNSPKGLGSNFHLAADLNSLAESDPGNIGLYLNAVDWVYPVVNNISFFEGDDGIHGRELLRSNGTAAGTYLVKDINPGEASTLIRNMVAINGKVYFSASTDGYSFQPWVTDGTEAGTQILSVGGWSNSPQQFIALNNTVYFVTNGYGYRSSIWQTDGTVGGTQFIFDIGDFGSYGEDIQQLTVSNGLLFFTAYTYGAGRQVWRSNGTIAGTLIVTAFSSYDYNFDVPMQLTDYNGKLYFSANDGTGRKLWRSDGTFAGTTYAPGNNDILMQTDYLQWDHTQPFPILNNVLYLSGYTYAGGNGLYKYNSATSDGLVIVKDFTPSSDPMFMVPGESRLINNTLYMKIISSIGGWHDELWRTNGDYASTNLVKAFEPGGYMISLKNGFGTLYFIKGGAPFGSELWKSDGTTAGTVIVRDVNVGPRNSQPWYITECNGKVLFSLHEALTGAELWSTNGSAANTVLVKDINTTATSSSDAGSSYQGILATNYGVIFSAFGPGLGGELYKSDGTANGTQLLNDINPGEDWSSPHKFLSKNGSYYFIAGTPAGNAVYKTDGNKNGLTKLTVDVPWQYSIANFDIADNGKVFYTIQINSYTYELWTSNGSPSGTIILSSNVFYNPVMITVGNQAFFNGGDYTAGFELWKSDGTITGTKMVKDIHPGLNGSYPYSFISYKGNLYFGAYDDSYIYRLWKSNGTEAGTFVVGDVQFPFTFNNEQLSYYTAVSNDILYFAGMSNTTYQTSLWTTDGTISGTKEVNPNKQYPIFLTDVAGTLFFNAFDLSAGYVSGLWEISSKQAAPQLVKPDIYMQSPTAACGKLYFLNGPTIWSSDGTSAGTNPVNDPFLAGFNSFYNLTGSNNKLFFSAYSYKTGRELFVGNACSQSANAITASRPAPEDLQIKKVEKISQGIYPNPARDIVHLKFYRQNTERIRISVTDITGRTVINQFVTSREGNNNVSVSVTSLPPGNYFIKLSGNKKEVYHFIKLD